MGVGDKVFRDPRYNYVCIDRTRDAWLLELVDTPEVQRLRRIHQLGVSNFTYPGADHNRLAHTLGVVHLMQTVVEHLERTTQDARITSARQALLAAALLHDVGHGPFSHLFEPCLGIDHEEWSVAIVLDPSSKVNEVLRKNGEYLPRHVADLIEKNNRKHAHWQRALLSSELDVDRLDYIRRDSLFTGAGYGHFDWFRLLTTVRLGDDGTTLVWPSKSALGIEEYIFARYYMYQNVYLHKTTRGFEQLLQALWRRATELRRGGGDVLALPALNRLWEATAPTPEALPVQHYLAIEEFTVLGQMQTWGSHPDKVLSDLARRFLARDGFAMVEPGPPPPGLEADYSEWTAAVHACLRRHGFDTPEWYCLADTIKPKYRMPYQPEKDPDQQTAFNSIFVDGEGGKPVEISHRLERLRNITAPQAARPRFYVPRETTLRREVEKLAREWSWTANAHSAPPQTGVSGFPADGET
jgi:HD superfamily phosphohydrolase